MDGLTWARKMQAACAFLDGLNPGETPQDAHPPGCQWVIWKLEKTEISDFAQQFPWLQA